MRLFGRRTTDPREHENGRLRAAAKEMPDQVLAEAERRTAEVERAFHEEVEARIATLDTAIDVQTGSGNGPR